MTACASPPVLWITGLSGVGKTRLAQELLSRSVNLGVPTVHVDGDAVRQRLSIEPNAPHHFTVDARKRRATLLADIADEHRHRQHAVIVSTVSLFHSIQASNRRRWTNFAEIWLRCDMAALRRRYPERYVDTDSPYVGVAQPAEFPPRAELIIDQDFLPKTELAYQTSAWQHWCAMLSKWRSLSHA